MNKKIFTIILAFLAITANAQDRNMAQDSTSLGGAFANMTAQQAKAQTIKSSSAPTPLNSSTPTSVTKYNYATCPSGFSYNGNSTYPQSQQTTTTYMLNGQIVGSVTSAPQDTGIDCTRKEYQTLSCQPGYQGSVQQYRNVASSEGDLQYGEWITSANNCTPIPPVITTENQTLSCGPGFTGNIYQARTKSTTWNGIVTYSSWNTSTNTCAAIPPVVTTEYQSLSCGAGYNGSISQQRSKSTTWNGSVSYGNWVTTSSNCTLAVTYSYTTEYQNLSCPSGQTGSISQQRTRTNGSDGSVSYSGWATTANNCRAAVGCDWVFGIAPIGTVTTRCNIGDNNSAGYYRGEQLTCSANGWYISRSGNQSLILYCE